MKEGTRSAVALLALGVILAMVAAGGIMAWKYFTAEVRGVSQAERQIESADSRINNYDHFYDLCAFVQTQETSLIAQRSQLEDAESEKSRDRIRSNIAGLEAQRARAVNQYNADASKAYTKARFLGKDLPKKLDLDKEFTSC